MLYSFRKRSPRIGKDTYVSEHALVIGDVKIGDNCYIGHGAILRGDYGSIQIGSGTSVEEGVVMHAPPDQLCEVGDKVTIGHRAIIHSKAVGDGCLIGMGAIVMDGAVIEPYVILAAGSLVTPGKRLEGGHLWRGSPVRKARALTDQEREYFDYVAGNYAKLAAEHKTGTIPLTTPDNPSTGNS